MINFVPTYRSRSRQFLWGYFELKVKYFYTLHTLLPEPRLGSDIRGGTFDLSVVLLDHEYPSLPYGILGDKRSIRLKVTVIFSGTTV